MKSLSLKIICGRSLEAAVLLNLLAVKFSVMIAGLQFSMELRNTLWPLTRGGPIN